MQTSRDNDPNGLHIFAPPDVRLFGAGSNEAYRHKFK
jgi:hypothetical protein